MLGASQHFLPAANPCRHWLIAAWPISPHVAGAQQKAPVWCRGKSFPAFWYYHLTKQILLQ
jgi:hypothetical protein